jgi:hypothetical protein
MFFTVNWRLAHPYCQYTRHIFCLDVLFPWDELLSTCICLFLLVNEWLNPDSRLVKFIQVMPIAMYLHAFPSGLWCWSCFCTSSSFQCHLWSSWCCISDKNCKWCVFPLKQLLINIIYQIPNNISTDFTAHTCYLKFSMSKWWLYLM